MNEFQIAGGSVAGTEHVMPGKPGSKNNHDAYTWRQDEGMIVAVVCDGCGSGAHSEVGANIGAHLVAEMLYRQLKIDGPEVTPYLLAKVKRQVLACLSLSAGSMGGSLSSVINDFFLFTVLGIVITPTAATILSCGDGVYFINGEKRELGPFPNNAPPYLAYNLTGSSLHKDGPELLDLRIRETILTPDLRTALIGTDGVEDLIQSGDNPVPRKRNIPWGGGGPELIGPIAQFWEKDLMFVNQDGIRRRLNVINREIYEEGGVVTGPLGDDTTLVVMRRR